MKSLLLVSMLSSFIFATSAFAGVWQIDTSHSGATFRVKHLVVATVTGRMSAITGTVTINDKDITKSSVDAELDASTIWTDNKKRDDHLRSADFLDVKKYPKIKFKSTSVKKIKAGHLEVKGNLTIKDVTKEVTLQVEGPTVAVKSNWGKFHRGITATTTIDRQEFNVRWSDTLETGGLVVGNDVKITLDLEITSKTGK